MMLVAKNVRLCLILYGFIVLTTTLLVAQGAVPNAKQVFTINSDDHKPSGSINSADVKSAPSSPTTQKPATTTTVKNTVHSLAEPTNATSNNSSISNNNSNGNSSIVQHTTSGSTSVAEMKTNQTSSVAAKVANETATKIPVVDESDTLLKKMKSVLKSLSIMSSKEMESADLLLKPHEQSTTTTVATTTRRDKSLFKRLKDIVKEIVRSKTTLRPYGPREFNKYSGEM